MRAPQKFIFVDLLNIECYLIFILICISSGLVRLCVLAIQIYFFMNCLFINFAHFSYRNIQPGSQLLWYAELWGEGKLVHFESPDSLQEEDNGNTKLCIIATLQYCYTFGNDHVLLIAVVVVTMTAAAYISTNLLGTKYTSCYVPSFNFHNSMT